MTMHPNQIPPTELMFVYCDDASHSEPAAVRTFRRVTNRPWRWIPILEKTKRAGGMRGSTVGRYVDGGAGGQPGLVHMLGDDTDASPDPIHGFRAFRGRHRLVCRKCKGRPLVVRGEKLYGAFDELESRGVSETPLTFIAAMLREQSLTRQSQQED